MPAALGNPPQPFRLLIDLVWDTLFVPSAECTGDCEHNDPDSLHFFSNRSSSYSELFSEAWTVYGTDRFTGRLARDTFRIAGLDIQDQYFIHVDRANPLGFISFYFAYDGVIGLAPRFDRPLDSTATTVSPSPWSMMVNQSVLDANIFTLELPHGPMYAQNPGRRGEITFGGLNPKYSSADFSTLPFSNYSDQAWIVEAQYLTWENETHSIHEDFENVTLAGFDTTSWSIFLPGYWPWKIYRSVDHECHSLNCVIDCNKRQSMPNFTFGVGGKRFTLTAFEYTVEILGADEQLHCLFDLYRSRGMYAVDAIVLGKPFMENFYR